MSRRYKLNNARDLASPDDCALWRRQLAEWRSNLRLVEERLAEFVLDTDPANLQLVKQKRRLEQRIADLEERLATRCPEGEEAVLLPVKHALPEADGDQRAAWREQLAIHRKNLHFLEMQLAKYGSLNAPLWLLNQIDDEKAEVQRLEALLGEE